MAQCTKNIELCILIVAEPAQAADPNILRGWEKNKQIINFSALICI
jgi:hypothetical protein